MTNVYQHYDLKIYASTIYCEIIIICWTLFFTRQVLSARTSTLITWIIKVWLYGMLKTVRFSAKKKIGTKLTKHYDEKIRRE